VCPAVELTALYPAICSWVFPSRCLLARPRGRGVPWAGWGDWALNQL